MEIDIRYSLTLNTLDYEPMINKYSSFISENYFYGEYEKLNTRGNRIPGMDVPQLHSSTHCFTVTNKLISKLSELDCAIIKDMLYILKLNDLVDELEDFLYEHFECGDTEDDIRCKIEYYGYPYWIYYNFWVLSGDSYTFTKYDLYTLHIEDDMFIGAMFDSPSNYIHDLIIAIENCDINIHSIIKHLYNLPESTIINQYGRIYELIYIGITRDFYSDLNCEIGDMRDINDVYFKKLVEGEVW